MSQLEQLMAQLNSPNKRFQRPYETSEPNVIPGSMGNIFHEGSIPGTLPIRFRSESVPPSSLQGDLLQAADAITTNMATLVQELEKEQRKFKLWMNIWDYITYFIFENFHFVKH